MTVDPSKKRIVLVVHGVQTGKDEDQLQHKQIKALINGRANGTPLNFDTDIYAYENLNDDAQEKVRGVLKLISSNLSAGALIAPVVDMGADLVGDVLVNLFDEDTVRQIKDGLKKKILDRYESGNPLYLLAHSLGSIYAFDVLNELIADNNLFDRADRKTWPVQGLITLGSPIGIDMFRTVGARGEKRVITDLGPGSKLLRWINYWDRTDPVVSGAIFGKPNSAYDIAGKFQTDSDVSGWFIRDRVVDIGAVWLMAHTGYWTHPPLGDDLIDMITH